MESHRNPQDKSDCKAEDDAFADSGTCHWNRWEALAKVGGGSIPQHWFAFQRSGRWATIQATKRVAGALCPWHLSAFLRVFFKGDAESTGDEPCVSSHSLKATTCLSWASKYGLDQQDKPILGRHADPLANSSAIYSRDLVVRSVRKLQEIIWEIFHCHFTPDFSRRGYFAEAAILQAGAVPDAQVQSVKEEMASSERVEVVSIASSDDDLPVEDEVGDSDPVTSSSASSSGESEELQVVRPQKFMKTSYAILPESAKAYRHKVSKVVHFCSKSTLDDGWTLKTFSCGRSLGRLHLEEERFDIWNMCKLCKQNAAKESALDGEV